VEKQQKVIAKEKLSAIGRYRALREWDFLGAFMKQNVGTV
jgi:hypothetical protein